jgi:hypothetical protein
MNTEVFIIEYEGEVHIGFCELSENAGYGLQPGDRFTHYSLGVNEWRVVSKQFLFYAKACQPHLKMIVKAIPAQHGA